MTTKATELNNLKEGNRNACPICNRNSKRVPLWKIWRWSLKNPGQSPWIDEDKTLGTAEGGSVDN